MGRGVVEREDRWCLLCGDEMGSVDHFVVYCRVLESKRKEWWALLEEELVKQKGQEVFVKLEDWRKAGENRKVVAVLLGGEGEGEVDISNSFQRSIDIVVRRGVWAMMKERRESLEVKFGKKRSNVRGSLL